MDLDELNEKQKEAVMTTEGPVMVMAGAGSGKTKVLTYRIAYIINNLNVSPYHILAVTFTNKAANEMKERIEKLIDINTSKMWISTFHSFCARLLRIEISSLAPYHNNFTIIDEEDSLKIIKEICKEQILSGKPKDFRRVISQVKNGMEVDEGDIEEDATFFEEYDLVALKYEEYLKNNNLLDFDDLILKTIELFTKCPNILEKYQRKFEYILVDEFQDTNSLQYKLMYLLALRFHNLFVVGDDFQSIYSFRGARIENINKFKKDFLETKLILLERNYRSTKEILSLANDTIKHNPNQIKKTLYTENKDGDKPYYYRGQNAFDEVTFVIDKIKELYLDGYNYSDIAVLYRANYISRSFEDSFIRKQIPYTIYGGMSFFQRKEIKDVVAYIRLITNFNDNFSFERIVNEPKRKVGDAVINKLALVSRKVGLSEFSSIPYIDFGGKGAENLKEFYNKIVEINSKINDTDIKDLIDYILFELHYEDALKADMDTYEDRMDNIGELVSFFVESMEIYEGSNQEKIEETLLDLALKTDRDTQTEGNSVILSTFHQIKGLEFKAVFMVALEEGVFPSSRVFSESEVEEERRIFYVGITRAKEKLYLSSVNDRVMFGEQYGMAPSRFLKELNIDLYESNIRHKEVKKIVKEEKQQIVEDIDYKVGDKILHKAFGEGVVVKIDGKTLDIAFKMPYGLKHLLAGHPSFKKL